MANSSAKMGPRSCLARKDFSTRRAAAARVRNLRQLLRMTREECAKSLGVTDRTVANWERGHTPAPLDAVISLENLVKTRAA